MTTPPVPPAGEPAAAPADVQPTVDREKLRATCLAEAAASLAHVQQGAARLRAGMQIPLQSIPALQWMVAYASSQALLALALQADAPTIGGELLVAVVDQAPPVDGPKPNGSRLIVPR